MINEIKNNKILLILSYVLLILITSYGLYAFIRGFLPILAFTPFEGLKTAYYLIIGSFNILLSFLAIIYILADRKRI